MNHYYCHCTMDHKKEADLGKTPIREVEVDDSGVCTNCGYYAIATTVQVKNRKELFSILRLE